MRGRGLTGAAARQYRGYGPEEYPEIKPQGSALNVLEVQFDLYIKRQVAASVDLP